MVRWGEKATTRLVAKLFMKLIYRIIRTHVRFTVIVAVFAVAAVSGSSRDVFAVETYDIALNGRTVIDPETGLNGIRNVGIIGTRIIVISENKISARREVDVTGLVVSPGFIDLHSHGQNAESNRLQALDGVTTALDLELGVYPVTTWYESRRTNAVINFGASVAHGGIRAKILHLIDIGHLPSGGFRHLRHQGNLPRRAYS